MQKFLLEKILIYAFIFIQKLLFSNFVKNISLKFPNPLFISKIKKSEKQEINKFRYRTEIIIAIYPLLMGSANIFSVNSELCNHYYINL